jgi:outer membrane protein
MVDKMNVFKRMTRGTLLALALFAGLAGTAEAQQRIAYIDSDYILRQMPEYGTAQQNVERLAQQWTGELQRYEREIRDLEREYQARELLYTQEERQRKQGEIRSKVQEMDQFRLRHFGPEGELFKEQQKQMRPIQERILDAVERVAQSDNYDYVFDRNGEVLFLFARNSHDLSTRVLEELGFDPTRLGQR